MKKPVFVLSQNSSVTEIVNMATLAVAEIQEDVHSRTRFRFQEGISMTRLLFPLGRTDMLDETEW